MSGACDRSHTGVARRRRAELLSLAREAALDDRLSDASRYGELAWRLTTRYQLEATDRLKRRVCRGCFTYQLPGVTARFRLEGGSVSRTCLECGRVRRIPVADEG